VADDGGPGACQNPEQDFWFRMSISRGVTPTNAAPFAYTPHKIQHVDPASGQVYKISACLGCTAFRRRRCGGCCCCCFMTVACTAAVPTAQAMSWQDGYECYGGRAVCVRVARARIGC
jgi:hypothetical protein